MQRTTPERLTNKKNKLAFVIGREMRRQVDGRLASLDHTTVERLLKSVPEATYASDATAHYLVLKPPMHNGQLSIFDFRKQALLLIRTAILALQTGELVTIDENSMIVTKYSKRTMADEFYNRETYLSNGRAPATTPYVDYNKTAGVKKSATNRKTVTVEIEL